MKARLETNANITPANLLIGIVSILTGGTLTSLPAGFNQSFSTLSISISTAGWMIHDANASPNSQVIKAAYSDSATIFKYLEVVVIENSINFFGYETWDSVSHTGTNRTHNVSLDQTQQINLTTNGRIYLNASSKLIYLTTEFDVLFGDLNGGGILAVEHSRIPTWNTATTYPAFAICIVSELLEGMNAAYLIRARRKSSVDVIGNEATAYIGSVGVSFDQWKNNKAMPSGVDSKVLNPDNTKTCPFMPIYLLDPQTYSIPLGHLSTADIFFAPMGLLAHLEVVLKTGSSAEYIAMKVGYYNHCLMLPNG